jgi:hypothetical protein
MQALHDESSTNSDFFFSASLNAFTRSLKLLVSYDYYHQNTLRIGISHMHV